MIPHLTILQHVGVFLLSEVIALFFLAWIWIKNNGDDDAASTIFTFATMLALGITLLVPLP